MGKTLIVGIGNTMMTDEGIGVRVAEALEMRLRQYPDVEVVPLAVGGMRLLHLLQGKDRLVVVDCARMNAKPGTIRRFTPSEVASRKIVLRYSLHEADILATLELAEKTGCCPEDVILFGIEPERVEPGENPTTCVQDHFNEYVAAVTAEVEGR